MEAKIKKYKETARQARIKIIEMIWRAQTSHIGSNFSCIDLLTVIFEKANLSKDKIILSKGWAAASLYYFLWKNGRISEEELNSFCMPGSKFIGLSEPIHPDIPFAGGSLGMGLPSGLGFAMAKKLRKEGGKIYVLMSDGEMQCGTTWESALIGAHHKLDNLIVFIDANKLQAMGKVKEVLNIESLKDKWQAFGWQTLEIDGHNFEEIEKSLIASTKTRKPTFIIARTIKGKGVSFMENNNQWHYRPPGKEEYEKALKELQLNG